MQGNAQFRVLSCDVAHGNVLSVNLALDQQFGKPALPAPAGGTAGAAK